MANLGLVTKQIMDIVKSYFKPEFLNRVDEIAIFNSLSQENLKDIVEIQLKRVQERLKQKNITLEFTQSLKDYLAREGYEPSYGARPLKRVIQNQILDELALEIIEGKIQEGQKIKIDVKSEKVIIK
jgi:ATP-dependent Clp protease ATP-binding subunit ClpB